MNYGLQLSFIASFSIVGLMVMKVSIIQDHFGIERLNVYLTKD